MRELPPYASRGFGGSNAAKATLAQWYHQYGEAATQQAVQRYAKAYPNANVSVQWTPGDYDKKVAAALLTSSGPDIFEAGNGPASTRSKAARSLRWTACWAMPPVTSTPR